MCEEVMAASAPPPKTISASRLYGFLIIEEMPFYDSVELFYLDVMFWAR